MEDTTRDISRDQETVSPLVVTGATTITVERGEVCTRGQLRPWRTVYTCTGPDGRQFDNTDKGTLAQVLRRYYGPVKLVIVDGPTWRRQP